MFRLVISGRIYDSVYRCMCNFPGPSQWQLLSFPPGASASNHNTCWLNFPPGATHGNGTRGTWWEPYQPNNWHIMSDTPSVYKYRPSRVSCLEIAVIGRYYAKHTRAPFPAGSLQLKIISQQMYEVTAHIVFLFVLPTTQSGDWWHQDSFYPMRPITNVIHQLDFPLAWW